MASFRKRVTSTGEIRWQAIVRFGGRRTKTGSRSKIVDQERLVQTFANKQSAKKWAREVELQVELRHRDPRPLIYGITVADAIQRKLNERALNRTTVAHLEWWSDQIGHLKLSELNRTHIERRLEELSHGNKILGGYHPRVSEQLRSPSTINRYHAAISGVFKHYIDRKIGLDDNPASNISYRTPHLQPTRVLTVAEIRAVLEASKSSTYPRLYLLCVSALFTGARVGELLALRWSNVDLESGITRLDPSKTKTRRERPLIWTGPALVELRRWADCGGEWVFPSNHPQHPLGPLVGYKKLFERVTARVGVRMRFHDWRHQTATYLSINHANALVVQDVLGHTSASTTKRYMNLNVDSRREALGVLTKVFENA